MPSASELKPEAVTALDLRKAGANIREIAVELNKNGNPTWTPAKVRKLVDHALEILYSPRQQAIDNLRGLEAARLDSYLVRLAALIKTGDTQAIKTAIQISERRARLYGLDADTKIALTGDLIIKVNKPNDLDSPTDSNNG